MPPQSTLSGEDFEYLMQELTISIKSLRLKLELDSDAEAVVFIAGALGIKIALSCQQASMSKAGTDELFEQIVTNMRSNYEASFP